MAATQETKVMARVLRTVLVANGIHPDKVVSMADGSVEVKRGYFYTHGQTADMLAEQVHNVLFRKLPAMRFQVKARNDWRAWPRDSYFVAVVREVRP